MRLRPQAWVRTESASFPSLPRLWRPAGGRRDRAIGAVRNRPAPARRVFPAVWRPDSVAIVRGKPCLRRRLRSTSRFRFGGRGRCRAESTRARVRDGFRRRPARGCCPKSRRIPASFRCPAFRVLFQCRPPNPKSCFRGFRRRAGNGRSRAGR